MQALDLIRELQNKYPIARARMRLRFVVPTNQVDQLSTALNYHFPGIPSNLSKLFACAVFVTDMTPGCSVIYF
jgi:hypothetical protein